MKKRHVALAALAVMTVGAGTAAYVASPTIHEGNPGETPELGRYGEYTVGTQELEIGIPDRVSFSKTGMATGQLLEEEMPALKVRLYYPAQAGTVADPITYTHTMTPPAMEPVTLEFEGRAFADAAPLTEGTFPLVIMSHGFNGWSTQFSNLAEHIASRGYVVASIDHADMQIEGVTDFVLSFSRVLANRTIDQRAVLADLMQNARASGEGFYRLIDPEQIGLVGYSMGGYGALATAGADYDYDSDTFDTVPTDALDITRRVNAQDAGIDALITFAPWGGQPDNRVWNQEALAKITAPTLIVSGGQDDVSNHTEGVSWIFEKLTGANRHMLTFREARHNIVGNAFDVPEDAPFRVAEFLSEPVWRQDRINGINQHFVAAFLDLHLKGDEDKQSYLDVPVANANDSQWETSFGDQLNGEYAGPDKSQHWRGFQKRWAAGLDMQSKRKGE
ncbi:MAG: dienelactone hydrolase [Pseudomonadota bacterium]